MENKSIVAGSGRRGGAGCEYKGRKDGKRKLGSFFWVTEHYI